MLSNQTSNKRRRIDPRIGKYYVDKKISTTDKFKFVPYGYGAHKCININDDDSMITISINNPDTIQLMNDSDVFEIQSPTINPKYKVGDKVYFFESDDWDLYWTNKDIETAKFGTIIEINILWTNITYKIKYSNEYVIENYNIKQNNIVGEY
jgi:hypothetical protein